MVPIETMDARTEYNGQCMVSAGGGVCGALDLENGHMITRHYALTTIGLVPAKVAKPPVLCN